MASLGKEVVTALLLGPSSDGRLVHDSPIRGDVWAALSAEGDERVDVLIEAYRDTATGLVASRLARRLYKDGAHKDGFSISFVEGFVAARLDIHEIIRSVLPFTSWAKELRIGPNDQQPFSALENYVAFQLHAMSATPDRPAVPADWSPTIARMAATFRILAAIQIAKRLKEPRSFATLREFLQQVAPETIAEAARTIADSVIRDRPAREPATDLADVDADDADMFAISLNRPVELAIDRSIPAVKADAVHSLFGVSCARIAWAVLDTGIDGDHPAFDDLERCTATVRKSRVVATYDFTRLRRVVLVDHLYNPALLSQSAKELAETVGADAGKVAEDLRALALDAGRSRPIDWALAERYVHVRKPDPPSNPHGTHVAGILGANWKSPNAPSGFKRGVCRDIRFYDFRVVGGSPSDTEFAVVGAMQFIRFLNARNNRLAIHGANVSLSIRHDVRNYACGRTPVCEEAERLVNAGVVVVAAAGNRGYQSYHLSDGGAFETYAPSSITDPGNAEAVITVGSTHRSAPHSYGVSFFSSRGPTGDGRAKPDLVAPGEKIWSVIPGPTEDALSGTSMSAPHVSGAAALLMARNTEFMGQAAQIKRILCATCTDLGREKSFQGAGMLDILRAMQSI